MTEPIRFYGCDGRYGCFSSFADHPIWIAGTRYATVAHWYQAMKTSDHDERRWIREASTPEEATARGRAISPRLAWTAGRALVMYRGVLAKFRQHPKLGAVLATTGNAAIHEDSDHPFWGFDGETGEDWSGRILTHVRGQLPFLGNLDGPLHDILRGQPFLNYMLGVAVRQVRNGGEAWLVHLIRRRPAVSPDAVLRDVLTSGLLRASVQLNGRRAVCFSALTTAAIEGRVFGAEASLRREIGVYEYSPFGIAVRYDFAREFGLHPVLPIQPAASSLLPFELQYLNQVYSPSEFYDYSHEEEWRYADDVDVREGPFAAVLPSGDASRLRFLGLWEHSVDEVLGELEAVK